MKNNILSPEKKLRIRESESKLAFKLDKTCFHNLHYSLEIYKVNYSSYLTKKICN